MNQPKDIIDNIIKASKLEDVIDVSDFKSVFTSIIKEIHPDKCAVPGAPEATAKMNQWRDFFEYGKEYKDDVGVFKTNGYWVDFKSSEQNLNWSIDNYRIFKQLKGETNEHFKRYIPKEGKLLSDGTFRFEFDKRAIPLSGLLLSQEHVNWVLSRLLEYCAYLSEVGFTHCGLNLESVFIIPENHGIQICSFYHLTKIGNKVGTISGKYASWYPPELFNQKIGLPVIDIECSKKIAAYLLGDHSGSGVKLRKTHNPEFIDFIVSRHENAYKTFTSYKEMIAKNFKKEFHLLTI